MHYDNKKERQDTDDQLASYIEKNFAKSAAVDLKGSKVKVSEVLAMLKAREAAGEPVAAAKSAWQALVAEEQKVVQATQATVDAFRHFLLLTVDAKKLEPYGIVLPKRRALTSEEKAAKAQKARATRKARRDALKAATVATGK